MPTPVGRIAGAASGAGNGAIAGLQASWAGFGGPERVAVVSAAVVAVAYLLGIVVEGWSVSTSAVFLIVGSVVVLGAVFTRAARSTMSGSVAIAIRGGAAVVGAFALVDLGDFLAIVGQLGDIAVLELILWLAYVVAGLVLVWAAWRATGASASADGLSLLSPSLPMPTRLVYAGAIGAAVGWAVILMGDSVFMYEDSDVAVLCAVLAATALWAGRAGLIRVWAIAPAWVVGSFAGATTVLAVAWAIRIVGDLGKAGALSLVGIVIYVVAVAALAAGAAIDAYEELGRQQAS
jgi:hypothetical protein